MENIKSITNFYNLTDDDYAYIINALQNYVSHLDNLVTYHFDMVDFLENYLESCNLDEVTVDLDNHNFWHNLYRTRFEKAAELLEHIKENRALCFPFSED